MDLQFAVVCVVVAVCVAHALWVLAPAAMRRRLAAALLRVPGLRGNARLARAAAADAGCACAGCDRAQRPSTQGKVIALRRVG